ncbi:MAG: translation initiation factor IF-2, partial [Acidimicrobiales bacterium]
MARRLRVYELARELGLTNKEALDLALSLGIGVKSHSSSIEDAQADRVRRKAEREGLIREASSEPETPPEPAKPASPRAMVVEPEPTPEPAPPPRTAAAVHRVVRSRPASELGEAPVVRPAPVRPLQSREIAPPRPAGTRPPVPPEVPLRRPLTSQSGKPIPPPPGRPRSAADRPIPPPPGLGASRSQAGPRSAPSGAARSGGFGARSAPGGGPRPGFGGGRPGGFGGRPGGLGQGRPPGAGGSPAAGGRGGPGGRSRQPQRRRQRRRRDVEELEPIQVATYVPSNAPVPDHEVIVERGSTPQELGPKLNRSAGDVIRFLFLQGEVVTATQSLSDDMVELFAAEIGARVTLVDPGEEQEAALQARFFSDEAAEITPAMLRLRPPIVTVMGHVDHGKTLLLDRIRKTNVVDSEAGGITQHIGAYQIERAGQRISFIDTPGHEAFTAMRARGAQVTDIVVLVVAADDGVMPQTIEAINHAKSAGVPIIVAVNKIDKEGADPGRVLQQLSEQGLVPEAWGGDTITVETSALQGLGIDELLDQVSVLAEVLELKASPEAAARGVVLEANLDVGRGPVATVIILSGTLRVGDTIVAGPAWGKVRALIDERGDQVKEALPSMPVQVLGLSEPATAGDELRATGDLGIARTIGEAREQRQRYAGYAPSPSAPASGAKLEDIFEQIRRGETTTLNLVLKADVQGSLEAVTESLRRLEREDVKIAFVHRAVGGITEYDVQLAVAAAATIIGFNVRPDRRARELAEAHGVEIRTYEIIYKLVEDIEAAMVGMLAPVYEEVVTGEAEVREIFRVPRVGAVAGCYVLNGT